MDSLFGDKKRDVYPFLALADLWRDALLAYLEDKDPPAQQRLWSALASSAAGEGAEEWRFPGLEKLIWGIVEQGIPERASGG